MEIQKHPHDEFFRRYFRHPQLLVSLLEFSLPHDLTATLDLSTIEIEHGTHIDEHLREHFSDLAATVAFAGGADPEERSTPARDTEHVPPNDRTAKVYARVYILVEHKSYKDPWALLQLLRYMVQVWSEQRKAQPAEPLVPIIPLLVYHGASRTVGTSFAELFPADLPEPLYAYLPRFTAELLNLTALPDTEIPQAPAPLSAAIWAVKYARTETEKTLAALDRLAATVAKALVEHEGFDILKLYIVQASPYEPSEFIDMVNRVLQTATLKEEAVGTAEKLIEQGKREGFQEGVARGRREGSREARLEMADRMLKRGFDLAEAAELTGLSEAELRELQDPKQS